ncbi:Baseplate J-like protein [uncultured Desulfobacterium sp.]|uniref:Baseplate J-like protein n=1 Tax=uncultured Desulfobacterium sp. TaxID=201089 RepID=A0A445MWJ1_9BACT|nr:Baseplate J-like protein [uncultured Desulfobacterium sp.]
MPFARPDLTTIIDWIASDLESRFTGADARLRRSFFNGIARALAGAVHGAYGFIEFLSEQVLPDKAEAEYMERWAQIWGVIRKAADAATGNVIFYGANGSVIPAGTILQRSDGAEFATDADVTIGSGTATGAVTASVAGEDGNTDEGKTLSLTTSLPGINGSATVAAGGLAGGAEIEQNDDLRYRLINRIQQPPHGGAAFDYEAWALEVEGVTRAWVYPLHRGLGTVDVTFVMDDQEGSITPDAGTVQDVQDYIDERKPVTADVIVFAPTPVALDFEIQLSPDTTVVRAAVEAELADLLRREAEPDGTVPISHIREAISTAAGETDHDLISPVADVVSGSGELSVMGTITWS